MGAGSSCNCVCGHGSQGARGDGEAEQGISPTPVTIINRAFMTPAQSAGDQNTHSHSLAATTDGDGLGRLRANSIGRMSLNDPQDADMLADGGGCRRDCLRRLLLGHCVPPEHRRQLCCHSHIIRCACDQRHNASC